MNADIKFYDTSALIFGYKDIFDLEEMFVISSITLKELEEIKYSNKSEEIKYAARVITNWLKDNIDKYDVAIYTTDYDDDINHYGLPLNNDTKILACAYNYEKNEYPDELVFITNDLSLFNIANLFFGNDCVRMLQPQVDNYSGYLEVNIDNNQLANLYQNPYNNTFHLLDNQYLIIKDKKNKIQDIRIWRNGEYEHIFSSVFKSDLFGKIMPYKEDVYQKLAFDSLSRNQLTVLKGTPGSGKSYLALANLFYRLEKGEINRIIMFCNPVAARDTAKLGYYAGDKNQKLLDSQIGNFLISHIGSIDYIQDMIDRDTLRLIPASDSRGIDIGDKAGVYVTEAQNLTIDTMQLILQRIGENCVCVIDGDSYAQVDMEIYKRSNGLEKVSEVFRGQDYYGEVTLKNCYRSKIAKRAELMRRN